MTKRRWIPRPRSRRSDKQEDKKESLWKIIIVQPLKKAWESVFVKGITFFLIGISYPIYDDFFQNPVVNFPITVEVIDSQSRRGLADADIFVQNTRYHVMTQADGTAQMTIQVRKKQETVVLTCAAEGYETQEKTIQVPEGKGPKEEFATRFVLIYN